MSLGFLPDDSQLSNLAVSGAVTTTNVAMAGSLTNAQEQAITLQDYQDGIVPQVPLPVLELSANTDTNDLLEGRVYSITAPITITMNENAPPGFTATFIKETTGDVIFEMENGTYIIRFLVFDFAAPNFSNTSTNSTVTWTSDARNTNTVLQLRFNSFSTGFNSPTWGTGEYVYGVFTQGGRS